MTWLRRIAALASPGLLALAGASSATPAATPRVVLAVDGTAEIRNLPVIVAERLGYFREEGLTVIEQPRSC